MLCLNRTDLPYGNAWFCVLDNCRFPLFIFTKRCVSLLSNLPDCLNLLQPSWDDRVESLGSFAGSGTTGTAEKVVAAVCGVAIAYVTFLAASILYYRRVSS